MQFLVRAHAWVAGLVPSEGTYRRQPISVSISHWCFSPFQNQNFKKTSFFVRYEIIMNMYSVILLILRFYVFTFREKGREGEREGEKH